MPLPHRVVRQEARDLEEFITLYDGRTRTPDPDGAVTLRGMLTCLVMEGRPCGGASGRHLGRTREPVEHLRASCFVASRERHHLQPIVDLSPWIQLRDGISHDVERDLTELVTGDRTEDLNLER